jgi:hypothetical protein
MPHTTHSAADERVPDLGWSCIVMQTGDGERAEGRHSPGQGGVIGPHRQRKPVSWRPNGTERPVQCAGTAFPPGRGRCT